MAHISGATALSFNLRYYKKHAHEFSKKTENLDLDNIRQLFIHHLSPGARILDLGCGSGRDSVAFLSAGYKVTAIDASPAMVHLALKLGIKARVMKFDEMRFKSEFDGIWACASLLHVPKKEISSVLIRCEKALKPGGIFFITLKEGTGERIAEDERFFSYYKLEEFMTLLSKVGEWSKIEGQREELELTRPWLNVLARKAVSKGNCRMDLCASKIKG